MNSCYIGKLYASGTDFDGLEVAQFAFHPCRRAKVSLFPIILVDSSPGMVGYCLGVNMNDGNAGLASLPRLASDDRNSLRRSPRYQVGSTVHFGPDLY